MILKKEAGYQATSQCDLLFYLYATWKGEIFVQDVTKSLLPVLSPERRATIKHLIQQYT